MKKILIVTLLFVTGCATAPKGWIPPWIEGNGKVLCPHCKTEMNEVPIYYGYPSQELVEEAGAGKAILGGCVINGEMPQKGYICPRCNAKFIDERTRSNVSLVKGPSKLQRTINPDWRNYGMTREQSEEFEDYLIEESLRDTDKTAGYRKRKGEAIMYPKAYVVNLGDEIILVCDNKKYRLQRKDKSEYTGIKAMYWEDLDNDKIQEGVIIAQIEGIKSERKGNIEELPEWPFVKIVIFKMEGNKCPVIYETEMEMSYISSKIHTNKHGRKYITIKSFELRDFENTKVISWDGKSFAIVKNISETSHLD